MSRRHKSYTPSQEAVKPSRQRAFRTACSNGDLDLVQWLYSNGTNNKATLSTGYRLALLTNQKKIIEFLQDKVKINLVLLRAAIKTGNLKFVKSNVLIKGKKHHYMFEAIYSKSLEMVDYIYSQAPKTSSGNINWNACAYPPKQYRPPSKVTYPIQVNWALTHFPELLICPHNYLEVDRDSYLTEVIRQNQQHYFTVDNQPKIIQDILRKKTKVMSWQAILTWVSMLQDDIKKVVSIANRGRAQLRNIAQQQVQLDPQAGYTLRSPLDIEEVNWYFKGRMDASNALNHPNLRNIARIVIWNRISRTAPILDPATVWSITQFLLESTVHPPCVKRELMYFWLERYKTYKYTGSNPKVLAFVRSLELKPKLSNQFISSDIQLI